MSFNLPAFVRDLAAAEGIPATHVPAVVHRAEAARRARDRLARFTPLAGSGPSLVIVGSLEGVEREIETSTRVLGRRVVSGAAQDHRAGLLERGCE